MNANGSSSWWTSRGFTSSTPRPVSRSTRHNEEAPRASLAWVEAHGRAVTVAALAVLWLGVGTVLAVAFSGRIHDWSVMTDELLYAKLATSIAETLSPLPSVHGISIGVYSQLYPLLIAPFFGTLSPHDAFRAAHWLNAFVMTSAAFPAYLLARQVVGRAWSFGVAALSILVPWMILTGFLMTESAAYPAFLWAFLGLQLAVAEPSPRRDLLAAGALVLAALARTQFLALALILPLAVAAVEISEARSVRQGLRAAFEKHQLLAALYAVGLLGAAIVAVVDSAGGVLGVYAVTVEEGSLAPSGIWGSAARHVDAVAIGSGLVPFVLGGGWILATVTRPRTRRERTLAWLSLTAVVAFTFVVASFGVRFGAEIVRDRYLFYVVPLLLVAAAAALAGPAAARKRVAIGAGLVALFFAATAASLPFTIYPAIWVDSPASVLNELLIEQSGGLATGTFVALLGLFLGLVLILALLLAPRPLLATAVVGSMVVFSLLTLRSEADRILSSTGLSGRPLDEPPGVVLNWVDTVVPEGEEAALVGFPVSTAWDTTAIRWWDVEVWNRRAARAFLDTDAHFGYTPFPHETIAIDRDTGAVSGIDDAPGYLVAAPGDVRFQLAGRDIAENVGLVVRSVEQPLRALWATSGLEPDGWVRPGAPARVRVFRPGRAGITLRAPDEASARYAIVADGDRQSGSIDAGAERRFRFVLCEPSDIVLSGTSSARIPEVQLSPTVEETRRVGPLVTSVSVEPLGAAQC